MNESDSYELGYETGLRWQEDYRPGGPIIFYATQYDSEEFKLKCIKQRQEAHDYMRGFDDGLLALKTSIYIREESSGDHTPVENFFTPRTDRDWVRLRNQNQWVAFVLWMTDFENLQPVAN